jgi:hypothetical protein
MKRVPRLKRKKTQAELPLPDTAFLVHHSAIEVDLRGEGPYDPNNTLGTFVCSRSPKRFRTCMGIRS